MSYIDNLKLSEEFVQQYIRPNASNSITAQVLQNVFMNVIEAAEGDISNVSVGLQRYVDLFLAQTNNIANGAITTPKLADGAVTAPKIANLAVTTDKLANEVTNYLLTQDMKDWLIDKMGEDRQAEAQALFVGHTENGGETNFVYGDYSKTEMKKDVIVTLNFNGTQVLADTIPDGWVLENESYIYSLSISGKNNVPSVMFTYTVPDGKYKGCTVRYNSESGEVTITDPIWYGFVGSNNEDELTSQIIGSLNYSIEDIHNPSATLQNDLSSAGYFCVVTKGAARAEQLGISILDYPKSLNNFVSPRRSSVIMSGYYVYFSKNTVGAGSSLGNVNLDITCSSNGTIC